MQVQASIETRRIVKMDMSSALPIRTFRNRILRLLAALVAGARPKHKNATEKTPDMKADLTIKDDDHGIFLGTEIARTGRIPGPRGYGVHCNLYLLEDSQAYTAPAAMQESVLRRILSPDGFDRCRQREILLNSVRGSRATASELRKGGPRTMREKIGAIVLLIFFVFVVRGLLNPKRFNDDK